MKIVSRYKIYKVFDRYKSPRRSFMFIIKGKENANNAARMITQKGLDIMGRINYWGETEWAGFSIA